MQLPLAALLLQLAALPLLSYMALAYAYACSAFSASIGANVFLSSGEEPGLSRKNFERRASAVDSWPAMSAAGLLPSAAEHHTKTE